MSLNLNFNLDIHESDVDALIRTLTELSYTLPVPDRTEEQNHALDDFSPTMPETQNERLAHHIRMLAHAVYSAANPIPSMAELIAAERHNLDLDDPCAGYEDPATEGMTGFNNPDAAQPALPDPAEADEDDCELF